MNKTDFLTEKLLKRKTEGTYRQLWQQENLVDFSSNDYLGFASSEKLKSRIADAPAGMDVSGSTGSRLLSGNSVFYEDTEKSIASFHQAEAGLIFNSGYDANLGLFSCIPGRNDTILYDEHIHASIKDGARLSAADAFSFRHNDVAHLKSKVSAAKGRIFIAVESVYSMTGDMAPLTEIVQLVAEFDNIYLIVDEAHATGIIGSRGEGLVQELGLTDACFARVHTFGKALGCHGAIVLGSIDLRNYLINFARSFIYTTALPPHAIATVSEAYNILRSSRQETDALKNNLNYFNRLIKESGLLIIKGEGAIRSVTIHGNEKVIAAARAIRLKGFDVKPVLSPTVKAGQECIRICLHAFNTPEEMKGLVQALKELI